MEFFEETLNSRKVYSGKIINLRVDEVMLPNGKKSTREIVEHQGATAIVAINERNEVIMLRQYRKPVELTILEIPAGRIEAGEDVETCAQRELMEEIGYYAGKLIPLIDFYSTPGFSNEKMYIFLATQLKSKKKPADSDENIRIEEIPFEEAVEKVYSGEIVDAKTIIGLLIANQYLKGVK